MITFAIWHVFLALPVNNGWERFGYYVRKIKVDHTRKLCEIGGDLRGHGTRTSWESEGGTRTTAGNLRVEHEQRLGI